MRYAEFKHEKKRLDNLVRDAERKIIRLRQTRNEFNHTTKIDEEEQGVRVLIDGLFPPWQIGTGKSNVDWGFDKPQKATPQFKMVMPGGVVQYSKSIGKWVWTKNEDHESEFDHDEWEDAYSSADAEAVVHEILQWEQHRAKYGTPKPPKKKYKPKKNTWAAAYGSLPDLDDLLLPEEDSG